MSIVLSGTVVLCCDTTSILDGTINSINNSKCFKTRMKQGISLFFLLLLPTLLFLWLENLGDIYIHIPYTTKNSSSAKLICLHFLINRRRGKKHVGWMPPCLP